MASLKKNDQREIELKQEEDNLAQQLKTICDKDGKELHPTLSAEIFHKLAKIYQKRNPEVITERMICLIQSAVLYNAAIVRKPDNVKEIKDNLKILCMDLLREANAKCKNTDLIKQANAVKKSVKQFRHKVQEELTKLDEFIENLKLNKTKSEKLKLLEKHRSKVIENLLKDISDDYIQLMANLAKFTEKVMGKPPCEYSLVGMGSLARKEITPYSDFENIILLKQNEKKTSEKRLKSFFKRKHTIPFEQNQGFDDQMINYFRWFSVVFQIVLINLQETIIPSASIFSLNNQSSKHGDWFYDGITPRGVCFDGMMPHACKFPLGRQHPTKNKPWTTELIKPVDEMLKYLNSEESLKNGYHLSTILTKTCYVYGSLKVYEEFENGVRNMIAQETTQALEESVKKQITDDLEKFATRHSLANIKPSMQINIKQIAYRSTTMIISEMGRLYKISSNSCFQILRELADKKIISESTKHNLSFAVSLACEIRLKWYTKNEKQHDYINSIYEFSSLIGKEATIKYFQIAYALQCDISKRLNLKKLHFYSNPLLLNISVFYCLNDQTRLRKMLHSINIGTKPAQRHYNFDDCLVVLNKHVVSEQVNVENEEYVDVSSNSNVKLLKLIGDFLLDMKCYDDAIECYHKALDGMYYKEIDFCKLTPNQMKSNIDEFRMIASIQMQIGKCCLHQNKEFEKAKSHFEKSLLIRRNISSSIDTDRDVAESLHQIGSCLTFMKKTNEAMTYLKRSLHIKEAISRDATTDMSIANTLHEIGRTLQCNDQYLEALNYLQKSIKIQEIEISNPKHLSITLDVIGGCFFNLNDFQSAKLHFERSLQIREKISRNLDTDRDVAKATNSIGFALFKLSKPKAAIVLFERALLIYEKSSLEVTTDRNVANSTYWIGRCLFNLNKPEFAKSLFERALLIYEKSSLEVTTDRDVANSTYWIGRCLFNLHKPEFAKSLFERAEQIYTNVSLDVSSNGDVVEVRYWIGRCSNSVN